MNNMLKAILGLCLFAVAAKANRVNPFVCSSNEVGIRFADARSCSRFFVCGPTLWMMKRECPKGLHFNEKLQVCDYPSRAGCLKERFLIDEQCENVDCNACCIETTTVITTVTTTCEEETNTTVTSPTPTIPTTRTNPTTITTVTTTCEEETTTRVTSPTPTIPTTRTNPTTITTVATTCEEETTRTVASPTPTIPTTRTNPTTITTVATTCDDEVTAGTTTNIIPTITTQTPTDSTISPTGSTIIVSTTSSPNCSESCCGKADGSVIPKEGECQQFIICQAGQENVLTCPNNLQFNQKTLSCDYPENAACPWTYVPPSGPSAGPSGTYCASGGRCVGQVDGTALPSEADANSPNFIVCQCECEIPQTCSKGLNFNPNLGVCDWPENVATF